MKVLKQVNKNRFLIASIVLVALFVVSRLLYLGVRPIHHDEGMLAYFVRQLVIDRNYIYTPQIHGPMLFYISAIFMKIFGVSDINVRLASVACGIILGAVPLLFRKDLGKRAAFCISLLLLVSPVMLYYSRFLVHTAIYVLFNLLFVLYIWRFFKFFRSMDLILASLFLAFMFGTSETTYMFMAVFVSFIFPLMLFRWKIFQGKWNQLMDFFKSNYLDVLSAALVFVLAWLFIYSVGLSNMKSLSISIPNPFSKSTGLGFWLSQNPNRLGGQPWYYYLILTLAYEPGLLVGYVLASINLFYKKNNFSLFLFWWTTATFVVFSWAGEKFPWLYLPSLIGLCSFVGFFIGQNWGRFKKLSKVFWIVMFVLTAFVAVRLNYKNYADTNELAVYVQTPISFQEKINQIVAECKDSSKDCVLVSPTITWPLAWSFRDVGHLDNLNGFIPSKTKFAMAEIPLNNFNSDSWNMEKIRLRDWWVPDTCTEFRCVPRFIRYYFTRATWNEKGGFDIIIYERK